MKSFRQRKIVNIHATGSAGSIAGEKARLAICRQVKAEFPMRSIDRRPQIDGHTPAVEPLIPPRHKHILLSQPQMPGAGKIERFSVIGNKRSFLIFGCINGHPQIDRLPPLPIGLQLTHPYIAAAQSTRPVTGKKDGAPITAYGGLRVPAPLIDRPHEAAGLPDFGPVGQCLPDIAGACNSLLQTTGIVKTTAIAHQRYHPFRLGGVKVAYALR